jgi:hypothetical protein
MSSTPETPGNGPNPRDAPTPTTSTLDCDGSLSGSFITPSNGLREEM